MLSFNSYKTKNSSKPSEAIINYYLNVYTSYCLGKELEEMSSVKKVQNKIYKEYLILNVLD